MWNEFANIKVGDYVELSQGRIGKVEKVTATLLYVTGTAYLRSNGRRRGSRWDYVRAITKAEAEARLKADADAHRRTKLINHCVAKIHKMPILELENLVRHFDDKQKQHPVLRNG